MYVCWFVFCVLIGVGIGDYFGYRQKMELHKAMSVIAKEIEKRHDKDLNPDLCVSTLELFIDIAKKETRRLTQEKVK